MVRSRLVWLVERVRPRVLVLVVNKSFLLFRREHSVLRIKGSSFGIVRVCFCWSLLWQLIVIWKFGKVAFTTKSPGQMVIMRNEAHMISVYCSEGCKAITHDREQGNENVVDDVDEVALPTTNINPSCVGLGTPPKHDETTYRSRRGPRPGRIR